MAEKEEGEVIDIDALMWAGIKQAARESSWIPEEYYMNDWVSDVENFLRDGGMFQTNAQLIAAAPDLLAALKQCQEDIRLNLVNASVKNEQVLLDAYNAAEAAIRKAEGEL